MEQVKTFTNDDFTCILNARGKSTELSDNPARSTLANFVRTLPKDFVLVVLLELTEKSSSDFKCLDLELTSEHNVTPVVEF